MLQQALGQDVDTAVDMVVNRAFDGHPDWILMATLNKAASSSNANERAILEELAVGYNLGQLEATFDPWSGEFKWMVAQLN